MSSFTIRVNICICICACIFLTLHFSYFYSSPHTSSEESTPAFFVTNLLVSGGLGLVILDFFYAWCRNKYNECLLNKTVERGTQPEVGISSDKIVPRPEIIKCLKKIFQPYEDQSSYHVICGEHGTGKTTLTKIASNEVEHGVIYVDTPANIDKFGDEFGSALNFAFEEQISFTGRLAQKILGTKNELKDSKWVRALNAFKRASAIYKKKYGKPPVIVYDNISHLVHKNPEILDILQDDAKHSADNRKYIAVFVSSEGSIPRRMESRSAWSRAKKPVMEIGDLNKEESMEYLIKKRNIKEVDAKKLYDLVGGRIVEIKTVADDFLAGQTFEVIKQQVLIEVEKKFITAQLLPNDSYYEVGKSIISDLLKSKELSFLAFKKYFKAEELNEVLGSNIFAYHPEKNTVSFQSQSVECYIREKEDIFIK